MGKQRIFARYPVPEKEDLREEIRELSEMTDKSYKETLDFYIRGRIGDIIESTGKILREKQRIKKARRCIKQALSLMYENRSEKARRVIKKYYSNILSSAISGVYTKLEEDDARMRIKRR